MISNRKINKITREIFIQVLVTLGLFAVIFIIVMIKPFIVFLFSVLNIGINAKNIVIISSFSIIIPFFIIAIFYFLINRKTVFANIEIEKFKITFYFLKELQYRKGQTIDILKQVFPTFPVSKVNKLYTKYKLNDIDINKVCQTISKEIYKTKLNIAYILIDISNSDFLLSIDEEKIIIEILQKLNINIVHYNIIKKLYHKKGLKEERKIIEEQNRQKTTESFTKSFLPYNAYKILGVSPSVTPVQLKKVYRTLAKQYHPDKFYGQSEAIIQKAEEKFQEITEAYEIIKKYSSK